jgi:hypothetical protein
VQFTGNVTFAHFYWRRIGFTLGDPLDKITPVASLTSDHFMTGFCKMRQKMVVR